MKRGEIWTSAEGPGYAGKPRPAVVVQDDRFAATDSITICGFTSDKTEAPMFRIVVLPNETNGLKVPSSLMVDKLTTVLRKSLGRRIGRLDDTDIGRLDRAVLVFLGLAG